MAMKISSTKLYVIGDTFAKTLAGFVGGGGFGLLVVVRTLPTLDFVLTN